MENFQWEVLLHDCIIYLSKYLFIVLLLYRLQIKWDANKKKLTYILREPPHLLKSLVFKTSREDTFNDCLYMLQH
jgi:hypothetical protein